MARVSLQNLQKRFGPTTAVADFSLDIDDGELVTFLGPSGCGKTTTLRMIAGFIAPTAGRILVGDDDITRLPVHKRHTGMVFQRYALFPHMTVEQNVAFGLEMHKVPAAARGARIGEALELVRMGHLRARYPRELSGGQQQRVAIARALAIQPRVFLLDEPLSNLDAKLRLEVREEIRALQQRLGLSTVFVTHDQEEALAISDRMAIMHDGIVQQVGAPRELYERPANLFVAEFLGRMNLFPGRAEGPDRFVSETGTVMATDTAPRGATHLGIRPERLRLAAQPMAGGNALACTPQAISYLGAHIEVKALLADGATVTSQLANHVDGGFDPGQIAVGRPAYACFRPQDCMLFDR
ncbi:ABC transporter ATP-binding protein [Hydrogenophaga borbori]|uniref:ABC transporter ATP-binding protein n=1 Tax=Hydrogenophaga borbori TaxID=2294117 RepID=A0A372EE37_9BURK|nr:ABC transporter ATP-binding protein [Hydrogenophaga borbori]RFP75567.1 ABC transporter ATP-binding protein [Hydrogenophaga borbori]